MMFYGWWIVIASFFIGLLVSGIIFYGFTAFFEPILREFNWTYTEVSLASSIRGMEMGILGPLVGYLADRWGSRRILLVGMATLGLGLILLGQIQSLLAFYAVMLIIAFGAGGCTSVVTMSVIARWFRRHLGKALAIMSSGFGASGLLLPVLVHLIDHFGWRGSLTILGVVIWGIGIPLSLSIRENPEAYGYGPDGDKPTVDPGVRKSKVEPPRIPYFTYLKFPSFLMINLAETFRFMALTSVVVHIMPYLSQIKIPRDQAGFIAAAIPLVSILGRFLFGWLGDVYQKGRVTAFAFFIMAMGIGSLTLISHPIFAFSFLLLFPLGFGGLTVLRGTIIAQYYDKRDFGSLIGIMMGFSALGGIMGPTFTGWIFDHLKDYSYAWLGYTFLLIFSTFLIWTGIYRAQGAQR
jgi:MFS family permease